MHKKLLHWSFFLVCFRYPRKENLDKNSPIFCPSWVYFRISNWQQFIWNHEWNKVRKSWKRNVSQLLLIFSAGLKDLAVSSQCIVVGFQFSHFLFLDRSSSAATNRMQLPPRARFSFFREPPNFCYSKSSKKKGIKSKHWVSISTLLIQFFYQARKAGQEMLLKKFNTSIDAQSLGWAKFSKIVITYLI